MMHYQFFFGVRKTRNVPFWDNVAVCFLGFVFVLCVLERIVIKCNCVFRVFFFRLIFRYAKSQVDSKMPNLDDELENSCISWKKTPRTPGTVESKTSRYSRVRYIIIEICFTRTYIYISIHIQIHIYEYELICKQEIHKNTSL